MTLTDRVETEGALIDLAQARAERELDEREDADTCTREESLAWARELAARYGHTDELAQLEVITEPGDCRDCRRPVHARYVYGPGPLRLCHPCATARVRAGQHADQPVTAPSVARPADLDAWVRHHAGQLGGWIGQWLTDFNVPADERYRLIDVHADAARELHDTRRLAGDDGGRS